MLEDQKRRTTQQTAILVDAAAGLADDPANRALRRTKPPEEPVV